MFKSLLDYAQSETITLDIYGNGGLFLVSTTLCLVSMGELKGVNDNNSFLIATFNTILSFFSLVIILATTICYGFALQENPGKGLVDLAYLSFVMSAIISTLSVLFAELTEFFGS